MSILIIGGAGYIGSHTAKLVAGAGLHPVIFDNLTSGHRWALKWGAFEEGDLGDRAALKSVLHRHPIDAVIQFAAHIEVGESVKNPGKYFRNNAVNTLNLLDAMVERGITDLVFSSTAAVYGNPICDPIPEDHPLAPVSPYGESKLFVERMLRWYGEAHGLRWAALRYFNAAGADPDGEIGEDHAPESHLIPLAIKAALGQRGELQLFGTDYPTPDGTPVRDYIHVVDLAQAHLLALRHLHLGGSGESFAANVGTGRGHSVRQVIAAVERASGRPVPVRAVGRRAGDPPSLVADPRKAAALLDWRPRHSDLDTIVTHAWRWHASRAG